MVQKSPRGEGLFYFYENFANSYAAFFMPLH